MKKIKSLHLGPDHHLTYHEIHAVAHDISISIHITKAARAAILRSRAVVDKMIDENRIVYGITTGFGNFKDKIISQDKTSELQINLIRSHSVGVGELLSPQVVRAAYLVRLNSLIQGHSGVRMDLIEQILGILNNNIIPDVPSQGSVGSSGDLAPLSHMGLLLMGEGEATFQGKKMSAQRALKLCGLKPIIFQAKEGLAWNNGTSVMSAIAALNVVDALSIISLADHACAMTLEAICGVGGAFDARVHKIRPHNGQRDSAERIRSLTQGSKLIDSQTQRVQDAYSLRCSPQVHGACADAVAYVARVVDIEINSVTDNPLIFDEGRGLAISGGNFHGESIAIAMDTLAIAMSEIANISERRTAKLVDSNTSQGLPMFLINPEISGLNSGFMMPQYTAAALVSENKVLAHPASVDSIPTSANQEDHVSMGTIAARKATKVIDNVKNVLAIEFYTSAQALEFRDVNLMGVGTKKVYKTIRKLVAPVKVDRVMSNDISNISLHLDSLKMA